MKKFLLTLIAAVCTMAGYAEENVYKTLTFSADTNEKGIGAYTETWSATVDGFTWDIANFNNNDNGWNYVKCGRKNTASVASITTKTAIDKAITKVVVTIDAITAAKVNSIKLYTSETNDFSEPVETVEIDKAKGEQTATLTAPAENLFYQIEFDCAAGSNGLVTVSKVEYYADMAEGEVIVHNPTITVAGDPTEPKTVTINAQDGAAVYYTLDGTEPTTESTLYTAPFVVETSCTVKAIAVLEGKQSEVVTKEVEVKTPAVLDGTGEGTVDAPYNVARALSIIANGEMSNDNVYVAGTISEITEVSTQYGNATYTITDGTNTIIVFRGKFLKNEAFTADDAIKVGDEVVVCGKLINYNNTTPEIAQNNYIYSLNGNTGTDTPEPPAYELVGNGTEENPYTVEDVIYLNNETPGLAWVKGYIVGCYSNNKFTTEPAVNSNIAIASTPDGTTTIPVELKKDTDFRNALNILDHPENIGKEVLLYGNLEKYFSTAGIKALDETSIDGVAVRIGSVKAAGAAQAYNLAGQRVNAAKAGLYIINGKKAVVK